MEQLLHARVSCDASPSTPARKANAPAIRFVVCVGPRCAAEDKGRALLAALEEALAAAFPAPEDVARISCASRDCLRLCTNGPVVRIEPSGDVFANPTIAELLGRAEEALSHSGERDADASSS